MSGISLTTAGIVSQTGDLGSTPTAFAGNDLVPSLGAAQFPHDDGLYHSLGANRLGELRQRFFPHVQPRLISATLQEVQWQFFEFTLRIDLGCPARTGRTEQGFQATTEDFYVLPLERSKKIAGGL